MKKRLTQHLSLAAFALLSLSAQPVAAQSTGKTGTTITLDGNSCHALYSSGAGTADKTTQVFGYLRHDIAHVQLVSSNNKNLSSTGTGVFRQNANNMLFDTNTGCLKISNWSNQAAYAYYAVVAPKGYRFTSYEWDINVDNSKEGTSVAQYTYDADGNIILSTDSVVVNEGMSKWTVNLANDSSNVLYFRYNATSTTKAELYLNSLKLKYVIDKPFDGQLPNSNGESEIHTGLIDMGVFTNMSFTDGSLNVFDRDYVISDYQKANVYQDSSSVSPTSVSVDDGNYYALTANGDYYVEVPQKCRIVGATFKFLRSDASKEIFSYTDVSVFTDGSSYIITDGNGHYLNLLDDAIATGTSASMATKWTVTRGSSYWTVSCNGYYLCYNAKYGGFKVYDKTYNGSLWSLSNGRLYNTFEDNDKRYLTYSDSTSWTFVSSSDSANVKLQSENLSDTQSFTGGNYTANVYTRDNQAGASYDLTADNATQTVSVSNYNNDAIHFNISGLEGDSCALYSVNLKLLPLNPEIQNLSVASEIDGNVIENTTSFSAENYKFNGGKSVKLVVPSNTEATNCNVLFHNAYNEERTQWYTNGVNENNSSSTGGYSNYFLVNSAADNSTTDINFNINATPYPDARTSASKAGTEKLLFTNIVDVYNGDDSYLVDNEFSKTNAKYNTATLAIDGDSATYYIYTADQPTYNILPSGLGTEHIDFRYFTLSLICKKQVEEPVVTLTPIYNKTLKNQNHKNPNIGSDGDDMNDKLTFIGVKVDSKIADDQNGQTLGYLTSKQVVDAIKKAIVSNTQDIKYVEGDTLRGVLYIDMSSLASVDNSQFTEEFHKSTADNCLYFMYEGFHRDNVTNTVAKTATGFEAVSNIKVYDQQPFYSPHDFTTGSYTATYEREGTVKGQTVKAKVNKMAVVLPFDVKLDGSGYLKSASDLVDNAIRYYNITGWGKLTGVRIDDEGELTYAVLADSVTDGTAKANEPYYVATTNEGFTYNIYGAQFRVTKDATLQRTNGNWTAIGTFSGAQPATVDNLWYFAKDYFWKSSNLKNYTCVDVRPFRAYFTTTDRTNGVQATVAYNADDLVSTAIGSVITSSQLHISVANGTITATADKATGLSLYTLSGQLVANAKLDAGESLTVGVAKGVYIVNNVKVVVK